MTAASVLIVMAMAAGAPTAQGKTALTGTVYCPAQVRAFVNTLTTIDGHLDVGVSYTQYRNYVSSALVAYHRIPVSTESHACLTSVGVPAERALNAYISALNSWKTCLQKVLDGLRADCASGPGYAARQRFWHNAHLNIARAVNALG